MNNSGKSRRTACAIVLAGAFSLFGTSTHAFAHDSVIGGTPADGEVVESFPEEIVLEFSGQPRDTFNHVAVSRDNGREVLFEVEPEVDGRDLIIAVPTDLDDPGEGSYTVGFQITSSDGHATRGKTTFEVRADEVADATAPEGADEQQRSNEPAETAEDTDHDAGHGVLPWVIGIGGVLLVGAAIVAAVSRAKRVKKL